MLLYIVPIYFLLPTEWGVWGLSILCFSLFFVFGIFMTNQFHKWSHADDPPRIAVFLQRCRLILPPDSHDVHHASPYKTYYCITNGWMNPIIDRIQLWRILEAGMSRLTGNDYSEGPVANSRRDHAEIDGAESAP